jgi:branched-chain amino acid transport system substrate-binding protein
MQLLWAALKKTNGNSDGTKLVEAMKGQSWTSVRGPVTIDPASRDIVQNVYIRKAEQADGGVFNIEFDKVEKFKDPGVE